MKLNITQITYHRNGVAGNGFHVALFSFRDATRTVRKMVATVFEGPGDLAVLELANIQGRWRGDDFEAQLREAIAKLYPAFPAEVSQ